MDTDFLKQLDEKFEERKKENLLNLQKLINETAQQFDIEVAGCKFTCYEPPASLYDEIQNMTPVEFAKKYFPILLGIPEDEIEKLPARVIVIITKKYIEKYSEMLKDQSFLGEVGSE